MNLSNVSRTAIFTLIQHALLSEKDNNAMKDPMAALCLERMAALATETEKEQIIKMKKLYSGIFASDLKSVTKRVMTFDGIANKYIAQHPDCTIINLACGFDTRYWRIDNKKCRYIEVDLPEVVALKKELLQENLCYELIGCSVLDFSWIDKVTKRGNQNFLIIAEGLLFYLPEPEGKNFLATISQRFDHSQFAFDIYPRYWTTGIMAKFNRWFIKKVIGFDITFQFGFKKPSEIESYGVGFKMIETKYLNSGITVIHTSIN